jgi:hypothetical protein
MKKDCIRINNATTDKRKPFLVNCKIEPNYYTYRAQMITADNTRKAENSRWKQTILNQASWKDLGGKKPTDTPVEEKIEPAEEKVDGDDHPAEEEVDA